MTGRPASGFTLVEVLVALFIMALLAAMSWRGLDAVLNARDRTRDAVDRTMRLNTVVAQWERDLATVEGNVGVDDAFRCDGSKTARFVRRDGDAVRIVVWALHGTTLQRWQSAPATRVGELQESWLRSQQLQGSEPDQLKLLEGVTGWRMTVYRQGNETNCQSSGDVDNQPPSPDPPASSPSPVRERAPDGVRMTLDVNGKSLTRLVAIPPSL
jgi:general secretion pathway protein J